MKDLRGTGQMYTDAIAKYRGREAKRKNKLKNVGHLMDQILVRKVSRIALHRGTVYGTGRMKARGNAEMLRFSPTDSKNISAVARKAFETVKRNLVKTYIGKPNA